MPLDANGIYEYDEDDQGATASDLLNLLASSVSNKVATIGNTLSNLTAKTTVQEGTATVSATHWDSASATWAIFGNVLTLHLSTRRAFTGGSSTDVEIIAALPSVMCPKSNRYFPAAWTTTGGGTYPPLAIRITPAGRVELMTAGMNTNINAGSWMRTSYSWVEA